MYTNSITSPWLCHIWQFIFKELYCWCDHYNTMTTSCKQLLSFNNSNHSVMYHWCATTPKEESALPSPGCLITYQVAHIATRSQGSYPIASVNGEFTLLNLMAGEVSANGLEYRVRLPILRFLSLPLRLLNFPNRWCPSSWYMLAICPWSTP